MSKPKLLIADSGLDRPWLMAMWNQWFDCEVYNPDHKYDLDSTVVVDNRYDGLERYNQIRARGYRMVVPYLMDSFVDDPSESREQELVLRARDWVWIQESTQWRALGFDQPRAPSQPDRFFLLLMNLKRDHRDHLLAAVQEYLPHSLYSYVARGIRLPDDSEQINDRLYVPRWYADTGFSLVSETQVNNPIYANRLFVSEKTFKPLAYGHAFVVNGTAGTLEYLHGLGFETFAHRVDQTYDTVTSADQALMMVQAVLADLFDEFQSTGQVFQDTQTQQILQHNRELFFDHRRVAQLFATQIVQPIMEFIES